MHLSRLARYAGYSMPARSTIHIYSFALLAGFDHRCMMALLMEIREDRARAVFKHDQAAGMSTEGVDPPRHGFPARACRRHRRLYARVKASAAPPCHGVKRTFCAMSEPGQRVMIASKSALECSSGAFATSVDG